MVNYTEEIQKLYVAYFNRAADLAGLKYWESTVAAQGGDTSAISAAFSTSSEYQAAYFGMSSRQIVDQIYRNLFGRSAESAGLEYWANNLDAGKLTMANVVTEVSRGAQGTDLIAFNAKVSAADFFTNSLGTYSKASYAGSNALDAARVFLSQVTDVASLNYAKKTILSTLESLVLVNQMESVQLSLTASKDRLIGGSGHDDFFGSASENQNNLNDGDVIDGGLGIDIINLKSVANQNYVISDKITLKNVEIANLTSNAGIVANTSAWLGLRSANVNASGSVDLTLGNTNLNLSVSNVFTQPVSVNGGNNLTMSINNEGVRGKLSIGENQAPTGNVVLTLTGGEADLGGLLKIVGGTTVSIFQNGGAIPVQVNATKITTEVNFMTNGFIGDSPLPISSLPVTINAANSNSNSSENLLSKVIAQGDATLVINNDALEFLDVLANNGSITINSGSNASNKKLDLKLSHFHGWINDSGGYSEINLHAGINSNLIEMQAPNVKKLIINGGEVVKISSVNMPMLEALVSSSPIYFDKKFGDVKNLKLIDVSQSSGNNKVTLDQSVTNYIGGEGSDNVTAKSSNYSKVGMFTDLGGGDNMFYGNGGNANVLAGNGDDVVYVGSGENRISLGGGANIFYGGNANNIYIGVEGKDTLYVGNGVNTITFGAGNNSLMLTSANASVHSYSTITDPHAGVLISFPQRGVGNFAPTKLMLTGGQLQLEDYADAAILQGGDASINAKSAWFQFSGNTYYVQSHHNALDNPSFQGSVDYMVKLTGLVDLSTASFTSDGNLLTLG